MTIQTARQHLADYQRTMAALGHASGLVYYDGATLAPKKSADVRPNTLGELSPRRSGAELNLPCVIFPTRPHRFMRAVISFRMHPAAIYT